MFYLQEKVSKLEKELRENVDLVDKARGEVKSKEEEVELLIEEKKKNEEEIKSLREEKEELLEKNNLLETRLVLNVLTYISYLHSLYFPLLLCNCDSYYQLLLSTNY